MFDMVWVKLQMSRLRFSFFVGGLLTLHGILLSISAATHTPVVSEVLHLPAGVSHLYLERFDVFRVNPPLVRTIAAVPVRMLSPETDWKSYNNFPLVRCESEVAQDFLKANEARSLWFFTVARWVCIPFSILSGNR
jgi:hypothetical protein